MDRLFEKAFSQAQAYQTATIDRDSKINRMPVEEEEPLADVIKQMLDFWKNKQYFRLMQLEEPTADELGRPVWPCTSGEVSKAYRRLSILVHPDKNPGDDARKAFEALNETHRLLKDPARLEEVLKEAAVKAKQEKERQEACASAGERVTLNAIKNARAKELRKEEGKNFQEEIMSQMKRRQEEAKRKAEAAARSRAAELQKLEEEKALEEERSEAAVPVKKGSFGPARPPNRGGLTGRVSKKSRDEDEEDWEDRSRLMSKKKKPSFM